MIGANKSIIYREVSRKMQEYENDKEVIQIFKLYETKKVENFQELGDQLKWRLRIFARFT